MCIVYRVSYAYIYVFASVAAVDSYVAIIVYISPSIIVCYRRRFLLNSRISCRRRCRYNVNVSYTWYRMYVFPAMRAKTRSLMFDRYAQYFNVFVFRMCRQQFKLFTSLKKKCANRNVSQKSRHQKLISLEQM